MRGANGSIQGLEKKFTEAKPQERIACPERAPDEEKPEPEDRNGANSRYPGKRQQRLSGRKAGSGQTAGKAFRSADRKENLLMAIQANLQAGKGEGYARWVKVFNLKEAAKAAFDALGGKTISKVAELSKEYAVLLEEKKHCYEEYKAARQEMIDFQTAKRNVDVLLGWMRLPGRNSRTGTRRRSIDC